MKEMPPSLFSSFALQPSIVQEHTEFADCLQVSKDGQVIKAGIQEDNEGGNPKSLFSKDSRA